MTTLAVPDTWPDFYAWLKERTAVELQTVYADLRALHAVEPNSRNYLRQREVYLQRFHQSCVEDNSPDALRMYSADEAERFWARTVPGPEGHVYWTGSEYFRRNDRCYRKPQSWAYSSRHGLLPPHTEVANTCGEKNCVNPEHLRVRPHGERYVRLSNDRILGALQVLAMRLKRSPTTKDWRRAGFVIGPDAVALRFGTWTKALHAAGLDPRRPQARDADTCAAGLRALARKLGHLPTRADLLRHREWLNKHGHPSSPHTIIRHLGKPWARVVPPLVPGYSWVESTCSGCGVIYEHVSPDCAVCLERVRNRRRGRRAA